MALPLPNLDDRTFEQLREAAIARARQSAPDWTDFSAGEPGTVLLELFAFLTDTMIYRLNRLPHKAYVEFLRLLGVVMLPPSAARVTLHFNRAGGADGTLRLPAGTRVTAGAGAAGSALVFSTLRDADLPAGSAGVDVPAIQAEFVSGELLGLTGAASGGTWTVARPPIVAPVTDAQGADLVVAIEARPTEVQPSTPIMTWGDRVYRIYREVPFFSAGVPDPQTYLADRLAGTVTFPPGAVGTAPPVEAGREVRAWYWRGGGEDGNVAPGTLTSLQGTLPGVSVTNPAAASGGQAAETLDRALVRGPMHVRHQHRAVTASDYEFIALAHARSVARARAFTQRELWAHGTPGTVGLVLVPEVPPAERAHLTPERLLGAQQPEVLGAIGRAIEARRILGTACDVQWARFKTVRVSARVVARRYQNRDQIRASVTERLQLTINALPTARSEHGWRFGQTLRSSDVYGVALAEPGVAWVDRVGLFVDEQPQGEVRSLATDAFQPGTWYAACEGRLFRSLNDGEGWEAVLTVPDETLRLVRAHPAQPGFLAVIGETAAQGVTVRVSFDCGESWQLPQTLDVKVQDATWVTRAGQASLLLATDTGLLDVLAMPGQMRVTPLAVTPGTPNLPLYAVAAHHDPQGTVTIAVAAQSLGGVYVSTGGSSKSFRAIGLQSLDVRVLAVQRDGARAFLWAGLAAVGDEDGPGCRRWELRGQEDPPEGWVTLNAGWQGGSCLALAFTPDAAYAASHHMGVASLPLAAGTPSWVTPAVDSGLPLNDQRRFDRVRAVAAAPQLVLAGGPWGLRLSHDAGQTYHPVVPESGADAVTLPPTWLFCSGAHDIEVISEDEATGP
ncbi:hypothetical protein HNQ07_002223 [Deinococcus metalli]|uniref:Baseplate assembly protein n=1 Tax=Deinococcus metalli TaxID=1141878 RepID=A0A7W8NNC4_9DEIO|nr:baseplate J/gp47 family protein [Deinococcus metalli]MBB5376759.1 hypothetical protein [Deinococcus metalli]GHF45148.1 hypothetical protein GCM10017781_21880 [Deinococcus metalli]